MKNFLPEYVIDCRNNIVRDAVYSRLYSLGFLEKSHGKIFADINTLKKAKGKWPNWEDFKYPHIAIKEKSIHTLGYVQDIFTFLSLDDLFSDEFAKFVEKSQEKIVRVELNSEYTAEVSKKGVKVGCQVFPLEIVAKLAKAVCEINS